MFYIASDHAGYALKEIVKNYLLEIGEEVQDLGANSEESVDYPEFGHKLAEKVLANNVRGIGICGSGIGISIALNRHKGIRAGRCLSVEDAKMSRLHNNANVLVLAGRQTEPSVAKEMVKTFIETEFEGGRHEKRVEKIEL